LVEGGKGYPVGEGHTSFGRKKQSGRCGKLSNKKPSAGKGNGKKTIHAKGAGNVWSEKNCKWKKRLLRVNREGRGLVPDQER